MKKLILVVLLLVLTSSVLAQAPWNNGKLQVSTNGRYLQHANGKPFFWLGDTAWLLFQKMDRDEVKAYFANRKSKGFNVVQCVVLQFLKDVNAYGDSPFVENDLTRFKLTPGNDPKNAEQYDFWDHVDYIAETAAQNGIYLAINPAWGQFVRRNEISTASAEKFAANLANHFKNRPNVVWVNGGSITGDVKPEIWETIGKTIKQHDPAHLMTFHPFGRTQSATWFLNSSWLDFNMFTSGHRRYDQDDTVKKYGEDNWRYVLEDLARTPRKPTLDGEPSYEATPQGLHDLTQPYWADADVRRYAYWSVFAGACGHTYGENAVRQVYKKSDAKPSSGAKQYFHEAMEAVGASQMQHLKNLVLSRPYFDRVNDQSAAMDEGEKYERVLVTKGKDFLMAYAFTGREFKLQMGRISGAKVNAWWFNPRTGEAVKSGTIKNSGSATFNPPGEPANGNDWVLVLDDTAKKFNAPGVALTK